MTEYHAAYYAHELTKRCASDDLAKLGQSLFNATVDLNPHQIDAALFAFRSPLSRGALLADEVGLGKTIEAGLIISQLWAEHRRRVLVIVPTMLRKQWAQELIEKFYIPSRVMDSREYNSDVKRGIDQPLRPKDCCVICSYHFARAREAEIASIMWDLVVIDEAHRLRNVYKPGNKIAAAIKGAVTGRPMALLTATPLQNSLLELFGLVSFIDEHLFGDLNAFRARYMRGPIEQREMNELRRRLRPICQRTLRRQVTEYIRFTNRIPITQDFTPSSQEQELYDRVSVYLQRETLHALPAGQRKLITLVLRKLLASSSFAIAGTLSAMLGRLRAQQRALAEDLEEDFESLSEIAEEWSDESEAQTSNESGAVTPQAGALQAEIDELRNYLDLATAITVNAKGQALLQALQLGFRKLKELGAAQKAVIFTESRRTQTYLFDLLAHAGYTGRVMTINGTNTDSRSGAIYQEWLRQHRGEPVVTGNKNVDMRGALVEHFRDQADIMIATEAAAEGVNLQFCSLVVNYDLPWNPQRIEQRIGRCHRYGQLHDVVVINFLNRSNAADQRVFELLSEKFRLFEGVFGSSDEVLGALESGVDFERRIAEIYQSCRTRDEIDAGFAALQRELEEQIAARMTETRTALLENFDEEVHHRLRLSQDATRQCLDRFSKCFWNLTKFELASHAAFDDEHLQFELRTKDPGWPSEVPLGHYMFVPRGQELNGHQVYRLGHPLAESAIQRALSRELNCAQVEFNYSSVREKIGLLEGLAVKSGWLRLSKLTVSALEDEDRLLFAILDDAGERQIPEVGERLFLVPGRVSSQILLTDEVATQLETAVEESKNEAVANIAERNNRFFDEEIEKLERWADDLKHGLEAELKELDAQIKQTRREAKLAADLESKLELHRRIKNLEAERSKKRRELYDAQDAIDAQKEELISRVEAKLRQTTELVHVMAIRWSIV